MTKGGFVETNKFTAYLFGAFGFMGIFFKNVIMISIFSFFEEFLIFPNGKKLFYLVLSLIWGLAVIGNFYFLSIY